ncbi:MAG TPA: DUF4097 family beta strand repeat-containing protein [Terriglobia bacterium]|nr:DUF4097 family beta strand repeat-containing protein [Terriglobia bacterium]
MSAYYRRGSIFWALTLIGVGFIFLYQNFNPAVHPWQIIGKFWPVLIIFWGCSKLIDFIQARAHPETAPPTLFSGSEVVLLILILCLGTLVSRIVLRSSPWGPWMHFGDNNDDFSGLFTNTYSYTETASAPATGQPRLQVINQHGDVEVHGSDQATIDAVVKENIHANDEQEARKLSEQLKFSIVQQGGQYMLQSNKDSLSNGGRDVRLDLTFRVPKGTSAQVTAEHGDVVMDGLSGDQTLEVDHGDLHLSDLHGLVRVRKGGGDTEVENAKGSVELEGKGGDVQISSVTGDATVNGEFSGDVEFRGVSGTLRYTSSRTDLTLQKLAGRLTMDSGSLEASSVGGPFELTTREKDITLDGFGHTVKIGDTNGDIHLTASAPPTHPIEVDSKKGEIELDLPPNSNFQIQATSSHGEAQSDFSGPNLKVVTEGDSPSIMGSYGKGGPMIRLSTAYGTIHLAHGEAGAAPEPPAAPSEKTMHRAPLPPAASEVTDAFTRRVMRLQKLQKLQRLAVLSNR